MPVDCNTSSRPGWDKALVHPAANIPTLDKPPSAAFMKRSCALGKDPKVFDHLGRDDRTLASLYKVDKPSVTSVRGFPLF